MKIKKGIIAAAGLGTRFLPATKSVPKEMLPILDAPIIQYLVEELVDSGIKEIIIITRPGFKTFDQYFSRDKKLENSLKESGKIDLAEEIKDISKMAKIKFRPQDKDLPYGNGSPILAAKRYLNEGEPFVYMFGDDMTLAKTPVTKQLIEIFKQENPKAVLAVQKVPLKEVPRYGVVSYKKDAKYKYEISQLVEKPSVEEAPSQMAQFGRFVLSYDVVKEADKKQLGKGNELWLADIINNFAKRGEKVIAQPIEGEWLTTGDPLRFVQTTLKFAMERPEIKKDLIEFIKKEII
ncbi:NTP transferase domain-containing protein [Patescibacteria group bacterium]|nr:NTP transferase domain-containing protein [Patescibacteria group bacterium]